MTNTWVSVDYSFPYTYSIRAPLSSAESALCLPAPSPATVRLAIIKSGIEIHGIDYTRSVIFPIVRNCNLLIVPPSSVAIATQLINCYKFSVGSGNTVVESISNRDFACATGTMTLYLNLPKNYVETMLNLCKEIGYWGQANSFTQFENSNVEAEKPTIFAEPFSSRKGSRNYCTLVTEFTRPDLTWEEITEPDYSRRSKSPYAIMVYSWPLTIQKRWKWGILLSQI